MFNTIYMDVFRLILGIILKPIIILNLKAYKEAMNKHLYEIHEVVETVCREFPRIHFAIAPNTIYLSDLCRRKNHTLILAQHADPVGYGAYTGHIPIAALRDIGADGFIINHSEHRVGYETIEKAVRISLETNLKVCVCAGDLPEVRALSRLTPNYVAFEPPELIGTGKSVSRMMPEQLKKSVEIILRESEGKSIPICGAGITDRRDVELAIKYGSRGILVASAFVKAKNKKQILRDFAIAIEDNI